MLSILKENILLLILLSWCCYQIHLDSEKHAADHYISLSEAWENLNSNKYFDAEICERAQKKIANEN
ncbi:hypothetical protein [Legionella fallonii]|uniref:Uncharacterized protein n=1 Tax=Legionella fallonii LLAP-10 TaxID=1212491 RepID=A0A098GBE1_9GAMM|nr:hypothetical protein [Legionella fallonii]CEG59285.1 protein of unknown function [Legionella fallonii LLAP-10]